MHPAAYPDGANAAILALGTRITHEREQRAVRMLRGAVKLWAGIAIVGQLLFACYVAALYGTTALRGQMEKWNTVMPHGHLTDAPFHNMVIASHLMFAVLLIVGGALQLMPAIRRRWPRFHRWNGRIYLLSVGIASVGGLVMVWTPPGTVGDLSQHLGSTLNAVLVLIFGGMAWRTALARRFDAHRRWVLRLFLAASGVWFFRIGLMLWILVNQSPAGFDPHTFRGPTLTVMAFAETLLPLAMLQLVFYVQDNRRILGQWMMAGIMGCLSLITLAGIGAATLMMWLPPLRSIADAGFTLSNFV